MTTYEALTTIRRTVEDITRDNSQILTLQGAAESAFWDARSTQTRAGSLKVALGVIQNHPISRLNQ